MNRTSTGMMLPRVLRPAANLSLGSATAVLAAVAAAVAADDVAEAEAEAGAVGTMAVAEVATAVAAVAEIKADVRSRNRGAFSFSNSQICPTTCQEKSRDPRIAAFIFSHSPRIYFGWAVVLR